MALLTKETLSRVDRDSLEQSLEDNSFSLDLLLRLNNKFSQPIFERTELPYIAKQYIGLFPSEIDLPERTFDLIVEESGPLKYNFSSVDTRLAASSASCQQPTKALHSILRALKSGGVCMLDLFPVESSKPQEVITAVAKRGWYVSFLQRIALF